VSALALILKEIAHRPVQAFLAALAVAAAAGMFVVVSAAGKASNADTARRMIRIGQDVSLISARTDMNRFQIEGYSSETFAEDILEAPTSPSALGAPMSPSASVAGGRTSPSASVAGGRTSPSASSFLDPSVGLPLTHLQPLLVAKVSLNGREVLLTGVGEEKVPPGEAPIGLSPVPPGTLQIGFELAASMGIREAGKTLILPGKSFTVSAILPLSGTPGDAGLRCGLGDAQALLQQPGRVSEIRAVLNLAAGFKGSPVERLRARISAAFPDLRLVQAQVLTRSRSTQCAMVYHYSRFLFVLVMIGCVLWIGALGMMNARERRHEFGVMRAVGHGSPRILAVFLGRAALLALVGAITGIVAGTIFVLYAGPGMFGEGAAFTLSPGSGALGHAAAGTIRSSPAMFEAAAADTIRSSPAIFGAAAGALRPDLFTLAWVILGAPCIAVLASLPPALLAMNQDPAVTLRG
jgi:ABC-type lipoprotein release transport system permease subunit